MKFKDLKNNEAELFKFFTVKRPWGEYLNLSDNIPCTVKILRVYQGESLSLQYHYKRDQLYLILDDMFKMVDGEEESIGFKGDIYGFPKTHVHRASYVGPKAYGEILDLAFGENDEEDIVRIEDKYSRDNGINVPGIV